MLVKIQHQLSERRNVFVIFKWNTDYLGLEKAYYNWKTASQDWGFESQAYLDSRINMPTTFFSDFKCFPIGKEGNILQQ